MIYCAEEFPNNTLKSDSVELRETLKNYSAQDTKAIKEINENYNFFIAEANCLNKQILEIKRFLNNENYVFSNSERNFLNEIKIYGV